MYGLWGYLLKAKALIFCIRPQSTVEHTPEKVRSDMGLTREVDMYN